MYLQYTYDNQLESQLVSMGTFAETAIVDYCLSFVNQGKQTSVFHYFCSKQMEDCRFRFPFADNKWKLPFSISSVFCSRKHGDMGMETWRHGDMGKWRHGDTETWGDGDKETWRHTHRDKKHGDIEHGEMET
jgi:hypothetical protein